MMDTSWWYYTDTDRETEPDGEGEGDHQEEVGDEHQQVHQPTLLTTASSR